MGVTSGRGDCMNNPECARDRNVGPIPAGAYYLRVSKPDEVGTIRLWLRSWTGDWGSFRVPLIPLAGTNIDDSNGKKRDGFKLHGGNSPGSAGCIDVGGGYCGNDSTRRLLQVIRSDSSQKVIVYVLYTRRIQ